MPYKQQSTVTQDLKKCRELLSRGYLHREIAFMLDLSVTWVNRAKAYFEAIENDQIGVDLPRVIDLHNDVKDPPMRSDRFHFFGVHELLDINMGRKRDSVKFSAYNQEVALEHTMKEAQNRGVVSGEAAVPDELEDAEILRLKFSVFKHVLERLPEYS